MSMPCHGFGSPFGHAPRASFAGGRARAGSFSTLEALHRWMPLPSGPSARSGHNACVAADGKAYVFGGCGYAPGAATHEAHCLNDLHALDLETLVWEAVAPSPASEAPPPSVRTCAAMCPSQDGQTLYLCGGAGDDPDDLRADLYAFDTRCRSWKLLFSGAAAAAAATIGGAAAGAEGGAAARACARIGHSIVHDAANDRLVIFGGSTGYEYFSDCYSFSLEEQPPRRCQLAGGQQQRRQRQQGCWRRLATSGEAPSPRYKHRAFVSGGGSGGGVPTSMYVVGGGAFEPGKGSLEIFRLDLGTLRWSRVHCGGAVPRGRAAHSLAWDPVGRAAYLWGGFTAGMELSQRHYKLVLEAVDKDKETKAAGAGAGQQPESSVGQPQQRQQPLPRQTKQEEKATWYEVVEEGLHNIASLSTSLSSISTPAAAAAASSSGSRSASPVASSQYPSGAGARFSAASPGGGGGGGSGGSSPSRQQQQRGFGFGLGGFGRRNSNGRSNSFGNQQLQLHSGGVGAGSGSGLHHSGHHNHHSHHSLHHLHGSVRPPARSFHAALFYRGSHYVIGGSNGAQKFCDAWRYVEAETPPSLAVLAAREVAAEMVSGELQGLSFWLPSEVAELVVAAEADI